MHVAYLDDSQQDGSLAMCGAVVIPHGEFGWAEAWHSIAAGHLFNANEIEERFTEFHAWELFKGEGAFKGIEESKRFDSITVLLSVLTDKKMPFIYSAIDTKKLAKSPLARGLFETAAPLIPTFKMCVLGVEMWARSRNPSPNPGEIKLDYQNQYVLIADETQDMKLKKQLRHSYRLLRAAHPLAAKASTVQNRLWHAHDAMYFGDSTDSVGIQLADLCAYFMQRRLLKRNPKATDDSDRFYEMFAPQAICAKPEPEWSEYGELFLSHV